MAQTVGASQCSCCQRCCSHWCWWKGCSLSCTKAVRRCTQRKLKFNAMQSIRFTKITTTCQSVSVKRKTYEDLGLNTQFFPALPPALWRTVSLLLDLLIVSSCLASQFHWFGAADAATWMIEGKKTGLPGVNPNPDVTSVAGGLNPDHLRHRWAQP